MKIHKYIFPIKVIFHCCFFSLEISGQNIISFAEPIRLSDHINSNAEELMPLLSGNGNMLYFTRSSSGRSNNPDINRTIWYSLQDSEGNWGKVEKATDNLNKNGQNTVVGFARNGIGLYILNKKKSNAKKSKLGISFLRDSVWSKPVNILKYKFSAFHGLYVHPSEEIIILSMETKNGYGKTDLYVSFKDSNNHWIKPVNLGATVNSFNAEISPFLSADTNRLYFASNGHKGYGDMDIFYCDRLYGTWNVWSSPKNLGRKVNSEHLDAYFSILPSGEAFFVSNRNGGSFDIYTSEVLPNTGQNNRKRQAGNEKNYSPDFSPEELQEILGSTGNPLIFFDKNSFQILPEQRELLLFIADKLSKLNGFKIVLIGHTDTEGDQAYNLKLSESRAVSVKNLFVSHGIDPNSIEIVPKGESEPVNRGNSEVARAKNRRVEIFILKSA